MSYENHSNLSEDLDETSGLAFSVKRPHLLYQINDSGNAPIIFRTDLERKTSSPASIWVLHRKILKVLVLLDVEIRLAYMYLTLETISI